MTKGKAASSILAASIACLGTSNASAATNQFRGVNWADPGDNFQSGVIHVSGLSSSDTYSSASTVAEQVMGQFVSKLGVNSVRLPINEATVSQYWSTYTGVIDTILTKGSVILCYWSDAHGAKPADMTAFWNMWKTATDKYGSNSNVYFEVYNEPNAYSKADLGTLYASFLSQFTTIPKGRVILDGTGMAQNVGDIGGDSRFDGCLLAVHEYTMFSGTLYTTEAEWITHFKNEVGSYADRTVCTEWGAPMSPGSKNGVSYGLQDYDSPPGSYFVAYVRGVSSQMCTWNMGSFFWAGLKDNDWYSMTTKTGSGSSISLSVPNQSGVDRMHYAWSCSTSGTGGSGGGGTGGTLSTGGGSSAGGKSSTGGTTAVGGSAAGGAKATGGSVATTGGTVMASGGGKATGGSVATTGGTATSNGGAKATGGIASTGGTRAAVGGATSVVPATGGAIATGGAVNATGGSLAIGSTVAGTGGNAMSGTGGAFAVGGTLATSGGTAPNSTETVAVGGSATGTDETGSGNNGSCGCRVVGSRSRPISFAIWGALGALVLQSVRRRTSIS